jgi:hypothetical protein
MTSPAQRDLQSIPDVWDFLGEMENPQREDLTGHRLNDNVKSSLKGWE